MYMLVLSMYIVEINVSVGAFDTPSFGPLVHVGAGQCDGVQASHWKGGQILQDTTAADEALHAGVQGHLEGWCKVCL